MHVKLMHGAFHGHTSEPLLHLWLKIEKMNPKVYFLSSESPEPAKYDQKIGFLPFRVEPQLPTMCSGAGQACTC